jgi:hypothetical protein
MAVTDNLLESKQPHNKLPRNMDELSTISSSSQHRAAADKTAVTSLDAAVSHQEASATSDDTAHSEEEEYLANDPYLAELLNSNHSRTSQYQSQATATSSNTKTNTTPAAELSVTDATRTWNDLSSVHSKHDDHYSESSSSSCDFGDSNGSMASFGDDSSSNNNSPPNAHHPAAGGESTRNTSSTAASSELELQKQAFQSLGDAPRGGGRYGLLHRSASVRVRPTYHGPKLGLIEESSLH